MTGVTKQEYQMKNIMAKTQNKSDLKHPFEEKFVLKKIEILTPPANNLQKL